MTLERVMELLRMNPNAYVSDILEVIDSESNTDSAPAVREDKCFDDCADDCVCSKYPEPTDSADGIVCGTCGGMKRDQYTLCPRGCNAETVSEVQK